MTEPRMTRAKVLEALQQTGYSVRAAAVLLGVHRVSLHRYMREQGIRIEYDGRVVTPSGQVPA